MALRSTFLRVLHRKQNKAFTASCTSVRQKLYSLPSRANLHRMPIRFAQEAPCERDSDGFFGRAAGQAAGRSKSQSRSSVISTISPIQRAQAVSLVYQCKGWGGGRRMGRPAGKSRSETTTEPRFSAARWKVAVTYAHRSRRRRVTCILLEAAQQSISGIFRLLNILAALRVRLVHLIV